MQMDQPEVEPESEDARDTREWLQGMLRDSTLWPVFLAGTLIFATLGAALVFLALGDRNPFAMAALAIVVLMSGNEAIRALRRGARGTAAAVLLMWVLWSAGALFAMYGFSGR